MTPECNKAFRRARRGWGSGPVGYDAPHHMWLGNVLAMCMRARIDTIRPRILYADVAATNARRVQIHGRGGIGDLVIPSQVYPALIEVDVGMLMAAFPADAAEFLKAIPTELHAHCDLWRDIFLCADNHP